VIRALLLFHIVLISSTFFRVSVYRHILFSKFIQYDGCCMSIFLPVSQCICHPHIYKTHVKRVLNDVNVSLCAVLTVWNQSFHGPGIVQSSPDDTYTTFLRGGDLGKYIGGRFIKKQAEHKANVNIYNLAAFLLSSNPNIVPLSMNRQGKYCSTLNQI
jgi:hypothetical protein